MSALAQTVAAGVPSAAQGAQPSSTQAALSGQALAFHHRGAAAPVFQNVSLSVRPREIVALLGGSGCGKSTLLRVLAGLEAPASGQVSFLGAPLKQPHPRAALVFQQASLLPWLDVRGNVGFGLDFKHQPRISTAERDLRIAQAIEAVGLSAHAHAYPSSLSGGMAQRVALARALAREPALLFADEPFSALDAITRAEMQSLLVSLVHQWQAAVLLVTHDIDEALQVADRIVLMGHGGHAGHEGHAQGTAGQGAATLVRSWTVDLPRPRDAHAPDTAALRLDILTALHQLRRPAPAPVPASAQAA